MLNFNYFVMIMRQIIADAREWLMKKYDFHITESIGR